MSFDLRVSRKRFPSWHAGDLKRAGISYRRCINVLSELLNGRVGKRPIRNQ